MLPDDAHQSQPQGQPQRLNAPTGAWCSLTVHRDRKVVSHYMSQCTYRCVVLPDVLFNMLAKFAMRSQCTYRCVVLPDVLFNMLAKFAMRSQCTYRCVVLPDPCLRERRYDATSRARSATGPGSTPPDRPAPGPE